MSDVVMKHLSRLYFHLLVNACYKSVELSLPLVWVQSGVRAQLLHYGKVIPHLISQPCKT